MSKTQIQLILQTTLQDKYHLARESRKLAFPSSYKLSKIMELNTFQKKVVQISGFLFFFLSPPLVANLGRENRLSSKGYPGMPLKIG